MLFKIKLYYLENQISVETQIPIFYRISSYGLKDSCCGKKSFYCKHFGKKVLYHDISLELYLKSLPKKSNAKLANHFI